MRVEIFSVFQIYLNFVKCILEYFNFFNFWVKMLIFLNDSYRSFLIMISIENLVVYQNNIYSICGL